MKRPTASVLLKHFLADATIIIGVLSIAGCFDRVSNFLYIVACFRFQYLIALLVCLGCSALARSWKVAAGSVILSILNIAYVAPYVVPIGHSYRGASER